VTCSAHTLTTVDSVGTVGQYTSLALDPSSGFPVISYYDLTNTNLKLAVCNNATCTAPTLTAVDGTGTDVGQYNSLAISSISGFPVISYFDNGNANLKLAVCNNATCTAPTLATLDGIGTDAGRYTSLALNTSGFPVVSYWAFTGNNLQVAVCNDATCTNPTFTIADGVLNDVGQYPSMKLDGAGNPVISYLESSNFLFLASIPATAATIDVYGGATAVAPPGA
jgi:hypothetical protein